jgi:hypothetical protein
VRWFGHAAGFIPAGMKPVARLGILFALFPHRFLEIE